MIRALLLLLLFSGCLGIAYLCLRHVFRVASAPARAPHPASRDSESGDPPPQ